MYSRYQKVKHTSIADRLRFLFTGAVWLRIDYDHLGRPSNFAVGFKEPTEATEATPEQIAEIQQQIDANRAAMDQQQGYTPEEMAEYEQIAKEEFAKMGLHGEVQAVSSRKEKRRK